MDDVPKEDAAEWSGDAARFSAYLHDTGQAFLLREETADDQQAHVRFTGPYQGREVVWDCRFVTLALESQQAVSRSPELNHSFIDIGEPVACGIPLRVCLNLDRIDLPAIQKMIIMIRSYKRLRLGCHAFGEHSVSP
jgi:hypothetical protein